MNKFADFLEKFYKKTLDHGKCMVGGVAALAPPRIGKLPQGRTEVLDPLVCGLVIVVPKAPRSESTLGGRPLRGPPPLI